MIETLNDYNNFAMMLGVTAIEAFMDMEQEVNILQ